jgi:hypothetical protein
MRWGSITGAACSPAAAVAARGRRELPSATARRAIALAVIAYPSATI